MTSLRDSGPATTSTPSPANFAFRTREQGIGILQITGFDPARGTATVRYQVADVFPDAANPSPKWLGLRFRDSGLDSRIRATLYQQNWTTGLVTSLGPVWDSDTMAASE